MLDDKVVTNIPPLGRSAKTKRKKAKPEAEKEEKEKTEENVQTAIPDAGCQRVTDFGSGFKSNLRGDFQE